MWVPRWSSHRSGTTVQFRGLGYAANHLGLTGASPHDDRVIELASLSLSPSSRKWGEYCSFPRLGGTGKLGGGMNMQ